MPILDENSARRILKPHLVDLRACVTTAWARYQADVAPLFELPDARMRANVVSSLMANEARKRFPWAEFIETDNRFNVVLDRRLVVRFKKLNDARLPQNYPTLGALEFELQPELPNMAPFARVTVGYQLDRLQTKIEGVYATCFDGSRRVWEFPLEASSASTASVVSLSSKSASATGRESPRAGSP